MAKTRKRGKSFIIKSVNLDKFPNCLGKFPDVGCQEETAEKPGSDCKNCPHFR